MASPAPLTVIWRHKSVRVKRIAFHPRLPSIIGIARYDGAAVIYDMDSGKPVAMVDAHVGPCRALVFHPAVSDVLATGGDDFSVSVWRFRPGGVSELLREREMIKHLDYVRDAAFCPDHALHPSWLLSCSDDQTAVLWNWQTGSVLATLTGHNHYVMSAQFHPTQPDIVLTASLDCTARIWHIVQPHHESQHPDENSPVEIVLAGILDIASPSLSYALNDARFFPGRHPFIATAADHGGVSVWLQHSKDESLQRIVSIPAAHDNKNVSAALFICLPSPSEKGDRKCFVVSVGEDSKVKGFSQFPSASAPADRSLFEFDPGLERLWTASFDDGRGRLAVGGDSGFAILSLDSDHESLKSIDLSLSHYETTSARDTIDGLTAVDVSDALCSSPETEAPLRNHPFAFSKPKDNRSRIELLISLHPRSTMAGIAALTALVLAFFLIELPFFTGVGVGYAVGVSCFFALTMPWLLIVHEYLWQPQNWCLHRRPVAHLSLIGLGASALFYLAWKSLLPFGAPGSFAAGASLGARAAISFMSLIFLGLTISESFLLTSRMVLSVCRVAEHNQRSRILRVSLIRFSTLVGLNIVSALYMTAFDSARVCFDLTGATWAFAIFEFFGGLFGGFVGFFTQLRVEAASAASNEPLAHLQWVDLEWENAVRVDLEDREESNVTNFIQFAIESRNMHRVETCHGDDLDPPSKRDLEVYRSQKDNVLVAFNLFAEELQTPSHRDGPGLVLKVVCRGRSHLACLAFGDRINFLSSLFQRKRHLSDCNDSARPL